MARMNGKSKNGKFADTKFGQKILAKQAAGNGNGLKKGIKKAKAANGKKPAAKNGKFADTAFGQKILARQAAAKGKKPMNGKKKK